MAWDRHAFFEKKAFLIQIASVFLILLSLYMNSKLIFFIGTISYSIITFNKVYGRLAGEGLGVKMARRRDRFFIDEEGKWELTFQNAGWPILNGEARIYFDENLEPLSGGSEIRVPFSIRKGETRKLEVPFIARRRGLARIRSLEIHIPSYFGFGAVILEYRLRLDQEVIVYPVRRDVLNKRNILSDKPGSSYAPSSLFEDMLSPAGTRDYMYSDGFKRIHWKASARTGRLQTKIYDRIAEKGIFLSINVSNGYFVSNDFEALLESAADIAHFAYANQIPLSVSMNIRNFGDVPFSYLPPGDGREQLQKVYEMLAIASPNHATLPYEKMVAYQAGHLHMLPCLIHLGALNGDSASRLGEVEANGIRLLFLKISGDHAELAKSSPSFGRSVLP
ncbi:hypothetical protein A8F94_12130 [Bacillus sp. FJAT-27225]|uniref:DUF58 domain-containing protein n=1 Tax=Bacillus sp. FJAT-27225 TaxID=1743144 RepID=UPI00080C26F9|nr:DUF58 domain-containing protein [Bacillus sp. FJAT-27225]OCA85622.1 hypothetical protein A8F94_12130 [Bacillus sp. FJAT-27225]